MRQRIEALVFWSLITGMTLMIGCFVLAAAPAFIALWFVAPIEGKVFIVGAGLVLLATTVGMAMINPVPRIKVPPVYPEPKDPWWRRADQGPHY